MEKSTDFMILTTESGRRFAIPCHIIAHDRARYYCKLDGKDIYEEEYQYALKEELYEWAKNNMNWSDVAKYAIELPALITREDMEDQWNRGELSKPLGADRIDSIMCIPGCTGNLLCDVHKEE